MDEFEQFLNKGDEAYKKDAYSTAVCCYENALKLVTSENKNRFKSVLPMMGRCYRKMGVPRNVIELAKEAKNLLGMDFIGHVFLTTIAAAYADLRELSNAHKCVNEALKMLKNGKKPRPLQTVIERLEK